MTKLSLLAVDPDLHSARTLSEAFGRADFEFRAVPDLRRALAVLRSTPVDAVLALGTWTRRSSPSSSGRWPTTPRCPGSR